MADARINLYQNLSVMLNAGVPITRALHTLQKKGKYGRVFAQIEQEVLQGNSLADVVEQHLRKFPKLDRTLIRTGEDTGQLSEMLAELSRWYEFRQRINRMIVSGMIYPILMIHALAFIAPVVRFALSGFDVGIYLNGSLTILSIFYIPAMLIAGIKVFAPKRGPLRMLMDAFVIRLPLVGKAVRELDLGRYTKVFAVTYRAGIPIVRCAEMAAESVSNSIMFRWLEPAARKARAGEEMSHGFSGRLPPEFIDLWTVGEESGQLDDSAWRLSVMHTRNAENRFAILAQWTPRIVYAIVAGVMIYYIFTGYSQIYGSVL